MPNNNKMDQDVRHLWVEALLNNNYKQHKGLTLRSTVTNNHLDKTPHFTPFGVLCDLFVRTKGYSGIMWQTDKPATYPLYGHMYKVVMTNPSQKFTAIDMVLSWAGLVEVNPMLEINEARIRLNQANEQYIFPIIGSFIDQCL